MTTAPPCASTSASASAFAFALAFALALALPACSSEGAADGANASFPADPLMTVASDTGALNVAVRTAPEQPPARGTSTVELTITGSDGAPRDGLTLAIVPWMPAHGHGTSITPKVTPKGDGTYVVTNVNLFMPGQWELRTSISGPVTDHVAPSFTVP